MEVSETVVTTRNNFTGFSFLNYLRNWFIVSEKDPSINVPNGALNLWSIVRHYKQRTLAFFFNPESKAILFLLICR